MVTVVLEAASGDKLGRVNYCWTSPAQTLLVPSPVVLMAIFYCLTTLGIVQHSLSADVRDRVTLRLAVYRQSIRLGDKPLETRGQNFFN
jgi:hypothetical protein